jgi:hypothetical protein
VVSRPSFASHLQKRKGEDTRAKHTPLPVYFSCTKYPISRSTALATLEAALWALIWVFVEYAVDSA